MTKAGDTLSVVVDKEYLPIDTCPRGAKVLLCTMYGSATLSHYDGKDPQFIGWYPLPKIPASMKRLMK